MNKKLYRDEYHKVIGGVCAGLAEYFDMDVTVVRLLVAFGVFMGGLSIVPYFILWIVLPKKGYVYPGFVNPTVDYTVPPQQQAEPVNPFRAGNDYHYSFPKVEVLPKRRSNAGIIVGAVLIFTGGIILADEYNFIPDFDWDKLWPVALVIVGGALIVSGQQRQPWENPNWHKSPAPGNTAGDSAQATNDTESV